jgi:hypothetical protein
MKFDSYYIFARLIPGLFSAVPFYVLHFYLLNPFLGQFWSELLGLKVASDVTVTLALLLILIQLNRLISKNIFEVKLFDDGLSMPTTNYLLHLDTYYSQEYTIKIHEKIKDNFGIDIPSLRSEKKDIIKSKKIVSEAVSQIRVKVGKGRLTNQHNAEYGFFRNTAGGALLAMIISLVNILVFSYIYQNKTAVVISIILVCVYGLWLIFSKKMITVAGNNYARILVQEFMS